jgi:hypothetical protein
MVCWRPCRLGRSLDHSSKTVRSDHANDADADPEDVQKCVSLVFAEDSTPGKRHGVGCVEGPHEKEWASGTEPTYQREAKDSHHDPNQLDCREMVRDDLV